MSPKVDALIVGGGIIGMACAVELAARGAQVTVIDKGEMGHGCSYGNAGWITPCFALPLPMSGMFWKSLGWLLDPEGPLYIQPRASWALIRWLTRFARSMDRRMMLRSTAALVELSRHSLAEYRKLDAEHPGAFGFEARGMLMIADTPAGRAAALDEMELVAVHGVRGQALNEDDVRSLEPAVTSVAITGGVLFPDEAHVEPLATVEFLARRAESLGARLLPRTETFQLERRGRRIAMVQTTRGTFAADEVVLATGAWTGSLGRSLRLRVPMLSGKGYAVTVEPFEPAPTRPIMLMEKKVAVTPRQGSIRLAGTLELVDLDDSINPRRVQAVLRGARRYLNVPAEPKVIEIWRGLRPCTPDGVPIIGRPRAYDNLTLAAGHQMLGLQTAPATGRLVADLVCRMTPTFDPTPFRPDRF